MRIVVSGWFAGQLATGTGQYLAGLQAWLPYAGPDHELFLLVPALQKHRSGKASLPDVAKGVDTGAAAAAGAQRVRGEPGWTVVYANIALARAGANLAKVWFEQVTFPRMCRRLAADVALVPYWGSPWWRPCPVVVTIHDIIPRLLPLYRGGPLQQLYTWLVTSTARRAAAVLTDSAASARDIVAHLGIPTGRVHALHLAVDPRFAPVRDAAILARVQARYRLPEEPFWLYLGGFDARKNLPRLLEAYARLAQGHARAGVPGLPGVAAPRLVIAGRLPPADSAFHPDPRPIVEHLGLQPAVHFAGWVDEADKPALYSLAAAAIFISEYEGFGLPVLEAQACGCPVLTSL